MPGTCGCAARSAAALAAGERAAAYFVSGFNCAESVLKALADEWGLDAGAVPAAATAFGGGLGAHGKTCGAIVGALIALGLTAGHRDASDTSTKERVISDAHAFVARAANEFGWTDCHDLTGVPQESRKQRQRVSQETRARVCVPVVRRTVGMALEASWR